MSAYYEGVPIIARIRFVHQDIDYYCFTKDCLSYGFKLRSCFPYKKRKSTSTIKFLLQLNEADMEIKGKEINYPERLEKFSEGPPKVYPIYFMNKNFLTTENLTIKY